MKWPNPKDWFGGKNPEDITDEEKKEFKDAVAEQLQHAKQTNANMREMPGGMMMDTTGKSAEEIAKENKAEAERFTETDQ